MRMKSSISKVFHRVGDIQILDHIIQTITQLDIREIVFVVSEDNRQAVEEHMPTNGKIAVQVNRNGTGSAARVGLGVVSQENDVILVTYGDVPLVTKDTYKRLVDGLQDPAVSLVMLSFYTGNLNSAYGRVELDNYKRPRKIIEYRDATPEQRHNNLCNGGIYAIRNARLLRDLLQQVTNNNLAGEYYLTDIVELACRQGHRCSYVLADEKEILGVNSREELAVVEDAFQNSYRRKVMAQGVTLVDPTTVFFSKNTILENDVRVEPYVVFMGDVLVRKSTLIKSFSYIMDCEIESGAVVGPFANICSGDCCCEIKRSAIGDNTSVGVGTTTCDFDGYSKFKTTVGKSSFIGSNSVIITPADVENNSLTAAGSVNTKNVNTDSLAIARAKQLNLSNGMVRCRCRRNKT
jgi:bifunctional UDP-N-acetylglucosamine pyrophosphorylase/glucosamine-1-phosphate N-acetyltransferase